MPRAERVFRSEAIILRRHELGEADRLLTVLTPDHGKLRGVAKGARRATSHMMGHVELFTRVNLQLSRGGELFTISQAEQVETYLRLREDLECGAYAYYVVELLDRFSEFEEPNPAVYALLSATLGWLTSADCDRDLTTRFFELKLLRMVGFQPSLFQCAVGQERIEPQDQFFSVADGGVVCPDHRRTSATIPLSLTALKVLRFLQTRDYAECAQRVRMDDATRYMVERTLQSYIVHLLEMRLKSAEFILRLRNRDELPNHP